MGSRFHSSISESLIEVSPIWEYGSLVTPIRELGLTDVGAGSPLYQSWVSLIWQGRPEAQPLFTWFSCPPWLLTVALVNRQSLSLSLYN